VTQCADLINLHPNRGTGALLSALPFILLIALI
jgi:hypothetical protein